MIRETFHSDYSGSRRLVPIWALSLKDTEAQRDTPTDRIQRGGSPFQVAEFFKVSTHLLSWHKEVNLM